MAILSGDRYRGGASSAYSPLMRQPNAKGTITGRAVLALALTIICPPLGLLYMWRAGVFRVRGRVLLTVLAAVELAFIFALATPKRNIAPVLPTARASQAVTMFSEAEGVTALSNMDELIGIAPAGDELGLDVPVGGEPGEDLGDVPVGDFGEPQDDVMSQTVYSVNNGAKFYHASEQCGTQTNRRQLTVQEALADGLRACQRCNPPSP